MLWIPKKRLTVPAGWRDLMGAPQYVYVFADPHEARCLNLIPPAGMEGRLRSRGAVRFSTKALVPFLRARRERGAGGGGRAGPHPDLRPAPQLARLDGTVVMVGALNRVQLWSPRGVAARRGDGEPGRAGGGLRDVGILGVPRGFRARVTKDWDRRHDALVRKTDADSGRDVLSRDRCLDGIVWRDYAPVGDAARNRGGPGGCSRWQPSTERFGGAGHAYEIRDEQDLPDGRWVSTGRGRPGALGGAGGVVWPEGAGPRSSRRVRRLPEENGFAAVDGKQLDLGVSSDQLDTPGRGFSFRFDGAPGHAHGYDSGSRRPTSPLHGWTCSPSQTCCGGSAKSRRRAGWPRRSSVQQEAPIATTGRLAEVVSAALGGRHPRHPATRVFQAPRMAVQTGRWRTSSRRSKKA